MTACSCHHGGYHEPGNPDCDQAILDGTATPTYAEAPIGAHPLTLISEEPGEFLGRCETCDVLVQSRSVKDALVEHLQDVRGL